jgi:uracil-DNA glycosylase family 4
LNDLSDRIVSCTSCPRLVEYLRVGRERFPDYWCRPVPGFGDPTARLLVVGLAPGFHGANRTGRPFCTDSSGQWLWRALHEAGAIPSPTSPRSAEELPGVYVTNAVRCAPPANRPTASEFAACRPFLQEEMARLGDLAVVLALGRDAHGACRRVDPSPQPPPRSGEGESPGRRGDTPLSVSGRGARGEGSAAFAHGAVHPLGHLSLVDSYHPSRQNTQTGKLTWAMFLEVVSRAVGLARTKGGFARSGDD